MYIILHNLTYVIRDQKVDCQALRDQRWIPIQTGGRFGSRTRCRAARSHRGSGSSRHATPGADEMC